MTGQPFSRILLATEHTEFDAGAERVAFELARHCALPLDVVVPLVSNPEFEASAPDRALSAEREVLARTSDLRTAARAAGITVELRIRRGDEPYREIVAEARARCSDLIVVRRRGQRSFLARMMVGEMVGNVVREAPCSVLLVPRHCRMWTARVLVAQDDAPTAGALAATASRIAAACAVPLLFVSVAPHDTPAARALADAALARAADVARAAGRPFDVERGIGPPAETLVAIARERGADLIVAGRGGHHAALRRLVFGSTAKRIVGLADCPVLLVGP